VTVLATLPAQVRAAGSYALPSTLIPDGLTRLLATLARNAWANTGRDVIKATIEVSYDGGTTWPQAWGFTAVGGVGTFKGQTLANSTLSVPLKAGSGRRVRGTVVLFTSLNTAVTVEGL
jgi:hypothetical protein